MKVASNHAQWYVADFETTGRNEYEKTGSTRVWLYSIADKNAKIVNDGTSIEEFMEWCEDHPQALIYFHNLRFDGTFILNYLFNQKFEHVDKLLVHSKRGFSTLIGDMGEYYQIKINFAPNKQVVIQDSLKIIPLKVKKIAEAFNLPIEKEIIDYDDYTVDDKRLEYVHHDVQIVAMAMKFFRDQGLTKMTIGSNAYSEFINANKIVKYYLPELGHDWLTEWRSAYRGGRSQVNPLHENKVLENVRRYDINSMYPYVMSSMPMPYGEPILCDVPGNYEFELYDIDIDFDLKDGHLPTLLKKNGIFARGDSYYISSESIENIKISSVDYMLLKRHYDIHYIKFNKIYGFRTTKVMFQDFIHKYYGLKVKSKGGLRLVYKLILNNLYGKFGSNCEGRSKIPYIGEDEALEYEYSDIQERKQYYLPIAIAIVSWAHKLIDDAILKTGYDNFVYCDTDSVHTLGTLPDEWVDSVKLGKFKLEAIEKKSKYVRQKCYITKDDKGWEITCCGMSDSNKEWLKKTFGDDLPKVFKVGLTIDIASPIIDDDGKEITPSEKDMKLLPKQVRGGTILKPTRFKLL